MDGGALPCICLGCFLHPHAFDLVFDIAGDQRTARLISLNLTLYSFIYCMRLYQSEKEESISTTQRAKITSK